jgi:hypothetical protein
MQRSQGRKHKDSSRLMAAILVWTLMYWTIEEVALGQRGPAERVVAMEVLTDGR